MDEAEILDEKLKRYYESLVKTYPRHTNWASESGHPCLRYLVLLRITPSEQIIPLPAETQPLLKSGLAIHKMAEEHFREAGCEVYTSPDSLYDKELELTGKMDIEVACEEFRALPVEIKNIDEYIIDKYKTAKDLIDGNYWSRKYVSQLALYLWMRNKERGIIHLRSRRRWKNIVVSILDPEIIDFVHNLLENLKIVNEHIKNETLPDRILYEPKLCKNCNVKYVCLPDEQISDGEVIIDEKLEKKLARRDELTSLQKEYNILDAEMKELFKGKRNVLVGNYIINSQQTKGGQWRTKIEKVGDNGNSEKIE